MLRLILIALLLIASLANARMVSPPVLNPKDYKSPSGEFAVNIDPTDMYGRGSAGYRVTRNGMLLWSGEKPFTLYEAEISDKGIIAGYAYTHGVEGFARERDAGLGEFRIVIMRSSGELVLDESIARTHSPFLHIYPNPLASAIRIDGPKNQFVIAIVDPDVNRRQDTYWTYQLSSGRLLSKSASGPSIRPKRPTPEPDPVPLPEFPVRTLKHLATFTLGDSKETNTIRNIAGFDFDYRGRIGFIRRDSPGQHTFVLISDQGSVLREAPLPLGGDLAKYGLPKAVWLEGEHWLMVASGVGVGAKASAWWLDATNGTFEQIADFNCPAISQVASLRDGGFVVLAAARRQYSTEHSLIAFDKAAKARWEIKEDHKETERSLFLPQDVAVTTQGRIAVVDNIRKKVQLFDRTGKFLTAINLEAAWKRRPNYASSISADKEDGFLVKDFQGNPPAIRMDAKGNVVSEFSAKHGDGRIIDAVGGFEVDASGRVWACDGQALTRLREDGVSDYVLGAAPSTERLGKIAALTVDQQNHIYAMDDRTGAVHVYDSAGAWLRVCKPDVTDFTGNLWSAQLAVAADGRVFARGDTTRFVEFAPDGRRTGVKRLDFNTISPHWFPMPDGKRTLIIGYQDAYITDGEDRIIRTIQRRPNGNWLEQPRAGSVAPDGSFAIVTGGTYGAGRPWQVHFYSPAGEPVRSVEMPHACMSSFFAYDGKVLITRTDQDICQFAPSGEPLSRSPMTLPTFVDVNQRWQCFVTAKERELWVMSATRKSVSRFQLP